MDSHGDRGNQKPGVAACYDATVIFWFALLICQFALVPTLCVGMQTCADEGKHCVARLVWIPTETVGTRNQEWLRAVTLPLFFGLLC